MAAVGLQFLHFLHFLRVDPGVALAVQLLLRRTGAAPKLKATQQGDHQKLL